MIGTTIVYYAVADASREDSLARWKKTATDFAPSIKV